jgi:hypothetical protein
MEQTINTAHVIETGVLSKQAIEQLKKQSNFFFRREF